MENNKSRQTVLLTYLALALVCLFVYLPLRNNDFVNFDDDDYVYQNRHVQMGISVESLKWAFTTSQYSNWHPITWISHILDYELYQLNPAEHHWTNLILHIANTLLLFFLLKKTTSSLWASAFTAAAFAIHPLHVESVAWISERKDVLSTLFWMLTTIAYINYVKKPSFFRYFTAVIAFAMGLMSKPMLVTLPFVLLLLDYWPLNRFEAANGKKFFFKTGLKLFYEKIPFFLLTIASSVITFFVQQKGGAVKSFETIPLIIRFGNSIFSYGKYILKTLFPSKLAIYYPHPGNQLHVWQVLTAGLLLIAFSVFVIIKAKKYKYLVTGWLWYLTTLLPVIGIVQVGGQALADRYTYIPLIGIFIIVAWGSNDLCKKLKYKKHLLSLTAAAVVIAMSFCTYNYLKLWKNSETLFQHAIDVTKHNNVMYTNLGSYLNSIGDLEGAYKNIRRALVLRPEKPGLYNNLGNILNKQGKNDEAIKQYQVAIKLKPLYAEAFNNMGSLYGKMDNYEKAIEYHSKYHSAPALVHIIYYRYK